MLGNVGVKACYIDCYISRLNMPCECSVLKICISLVGIKLPS